MSPDRPSLSNVVKAVADAASGDHAQQESNAPGELKQLLAERLAAIDQAFKVDGPFWRQRKRSYLQKRRLPLP